jgi:hypothetical protein
VPHATPTLIIEKMFKAVISLSPSVALTSKWPPQTPRGTLESIKRR